MIEKLVEVLSAWLCWVSALCIVGMMLLTSSDVVVRYLGYPIKGTYDIVGLLGALVVALPIARTQVLNRHVSMDFMAQRKSRIARGIAQAYVKSMAAKGLPGKEALAYRQQLIQKYEKMYPKLKYE